MTTEELKREMFYAIAGMKGRIEINHSIKDMLSGVDNFEHALEAYLEALRQESSRSADRLEATQHHNEILSGAYARQQQLTHAACKEEREAWVDIKQLEADLKTSRDREAFLESLCSGFEEQLGIASGQRDQYRNKLQAFEFANKSAGELLIRAQETIKRQRKFIRTLYTSRNKTKATGCSSNKSTKT